MRYKTLVIGLVFFILPAFAHAALININTADATTLDTLPYVTPTGAQNIVDYRRIKGPFVVIEDIMKVDGIKSGIFSHIQSLITVGDASAADQSATTTDAAVTDPIAVPSSGAATTYAPPPADLLVQLRGEETAILEVPVSFSALVKTKSGAIDSAALVRWSFGDGSWTEGIMVTKTYHYAGTYRVVATATDGSTNARDELTVTVGSPSVRIALISGEGITLANDGNDEMDLSLWRLTSSRGIFRIPLGTILLPKSSVLFPFSIINLSTAFDATLTYPNGVVAASYTPQSVAVAASSTAVQPVAVLASSNQTKTVESIISQRISLLPHDQGIIAPAAAKDLAVAGAALSLATTSSAASVAPVVSKHSLLSSPWTLGLGGVMVLASIAFVLL